MGHYLWKWEGTSWGIFCKNHHVAFIVLLECQVPCLSRKGTLLTNNSLALTAALLMGLSYPTGLFELLIVGRLFTGINAGKKNPFRNAFSDIPASLYCMWNQVIEVKTSDIWQQLCFIFKGIGLCVQPLYLGEIAPTVLRGAMGMGTSIFITVGILLGQVIGLK